ncbi:MAG: 1-phosphofructokinase [Dehalococcoidales bacterium]
MIATVTLNPALDQHITVDGLMVEEANRWVKLRPYAGGKGIDVSRAIHEMDCLSTAYGFIGGAVGRTLEILLDEEGVLFSFTPIQKETRTNFIITDTRTSQQTRIDAPGPRITRKELNRFVAKMKNIRPKPDILVAGGSIPPGVPEDIYYEMVQDAHGFGVKTILDCSGKGLEEGIKARPFLIKPNVHEIERLLGRKLPDEKSIIKAAFELVAEGVEIVVISRNKEGLIAASRDQVVKAVPPPVKIKSTVGAGDCTVAGLAIRLANGDSLTEACRLAAAMGTAAVLTPGTALCIHRDVNRLLPRIKVLELPDKYDAR